MKCRACGFEHPHGVSRCEAAKRIRERSAVVEKQPAAMVETAQPVRRAVETSAALVETSSRHGKHKDAEAHRIKMREHMRLKRAAVKALS